MSIHKKTHSVHQYSLVDTSMLCLSDEEYEKEGGARYSTAITKNHFCQSINQSLVFEGRKEMKDIISNTQPEHCTS